MFPSCNGLGPSTSILPGESDPSPLSGESSASTPRFRWCDPGLTSNFFAAGDGDAAAAALVVRGLDRPSELDPEPEADLDESDWSSMKPRHLRQPSKSMRACMQPHSVTFCSSHSKRTGWFG